MLRRTTTHSPQLRITSTLVENATKKMAGFLNVEDHLHTRGECFLTIKPSSIAFGSPPHSWRMPRFELLERYLTGITSTLVENACLFVCNLLCSEDHLHTRGECFTSFYNLMFAAGSPPHSWRMPASDC